jgi:hypothetical protein
MVQREREIDGRLQAAAMAAYGGGAGELGRVREVAGEVRVVVEGNAGPFIGGGKGEVAGRRVAQGAHSNGGRDARSLVEEGGDRRGSYGGAVLNGTGAAAGQVALAC